MSFNPFLNLVLPLFASFYESEDQKIILLMEYVSGNLRNFNPKIIDLKKNEENSEEIMTDNSIILELIDEPNSIAHFIPITNKERKLFSHTLFFSVYLKENGKTKLEKNDIITKIEKLTKNHPDIYNSKLPQMVNEVFNRYKKHINHLKKKWTIKKNNNHSYSTFKKKLQKFDEFKN